jgi:exodeoxyribonuclease VII small subunit
MRKQELAMANEAGEGAAGTPAAFEDALARLEGLVESLDSGRLDLEESLRLYEEGVRLVRQCEERLRAAELRIRTLELDGRGGLRETTLEEGPDA